MTKTVPSNNSIFDLCEYLENNNSDGFVEAVGNLRDGSLNVTSGDGSNICAILSEIKEDKDLMRKFLAKINVATANQKEQYLLFQGVTNSRELEILGYILERGFDPGATDERGYDSLHTPAEQTQSVSKTPTANKGRATEGFEKKRSDAVAIKMMLRTGKISDFEGDKGIEEYEKIRQIEEENIRDREQYCAKLKEHFAKFYNRKTNHPELKTEPVEIGNYEDHKCFTAIEVAERKHRESMDRVLLHVQSDSAREDEKEILASNPRYKPQADNEERTPGNSPTNSFITKLCNLISGRGWN